MDTEVMTTQVFYVDDVGWVMAYPSTSVHPDVMPLPEEGIVRVVDPDGQETQLEVLGSQTTHVAAASGNEPVTEPIQHPVSITVEDLHVEVKQPLSFRSLRSDLRRRFPATKERGSDTPPSRMRTLLDSVTFAVEPGELVAVIGPSGAGKSTLIKALIGEHDFSGVLKYNAEEFDQGSPESLARLRVLLGYVPQQDILHGELSMRHALLYAARLRLPRLSRFEQHQAVIDELRALGLEKQADQPLRSASGGERKRASAATELLTRPPILFLDEPTTGLDADTEENLMRVLQKLAHRGRHTVVLNTHSIPALEMADKVIVIAGGQLAYVGPPELVQSIFAPARFEAPTATQQAPGVAVATRPYPAMYRRLHENPSEWAKKFGQSPNYHRFVEDVIARNRVSPRVLPSESGSWASRASQFATLAHRNVAVNTGARGYSWLLLLQTPLLLALLLSFVGFGNLSAHAGADPRALLTLLVFATMAVGLVDSCREIAKELPVYNRERGAGLSVGAYLAAKFAVLAGFSCLQSFVLSFALVGQGGPSQGLVLGSPFIEHWLLIWLGLLATTSLGLLVSALAQSDARAQLMIPVVLVLELLLSGALLDVQKVSAATASYWLFDGLAASTSLTDVDPGCITKPSATKTSAAEIGSAKAPASQRPESCPDVWRHEPEALVMSLSWLTVLTLIHLALTLLALEKLRFVTT